MILNLEPFYYKHFLFTIPVHISYCKYILFISLDELSEFSLKIVITKLKKI